MNKSKKVDVFYDPTGKQAESLHEKGSKQYGDLWYNAHQALTTQLADKVDLSDPAIKELFGWAALTVLNRLRLNGVIQFDKDYEAGK